jgi:hypothetical protein
LLPAEFDLPEFAFADRVAQDVLAKLGLLFSPRMIMPAPSAATGFLCVVRHCNNRGRRGVIILLQARGLVWLSLSEALLFPLNVDLWLRNQYAVQNFAGFPRGTICRL